MSSSATEAGDDRRGKTAGSDFLWGGLLPAEFLDRPNRFVVHCALDNGKEVRAHLANPGRLVELLVPGARVHLSPTTDPKRATPYSVTLVEADGGELVSLDTGLPNRIVADALRSGVLTEFTGWQLERAEARLGASRIDFLLTDGRRRLALEVKSVSLLVEGDGLFPDAVTTRGARHLEELTAAVGRDDWEAAVLFVVQRDGARRVRAASEIDPAFAAAVEAAKAAGVRFHARALVVSRVGVKLGGALPVV